MALPQEIEKQVFEEMTLWLVKNRPEEHIRPQLDIGYRLEKQDLYLYEIRPFLLNTKEVRHYDFARAGYIKSKKCWKIYWKRANLKWNGYEPRLFVNDLGEFLQEVKNDPFGCFRG